jgi:hypothetical protein
MENITYIYGLKDPITNEIRYVGKADNPKKRYSEHLKDKTSNSHKSRWIEGLQKIGERPILVIIEEVNQNNWKEKEIEWISYGKRNWKLTNITDGGEGVVISKWVLSMRGIIEGDYMDRYSSFTEDLQKEIAHKTAIGIYKDRHNSIEKAREIARNLIDKVI